MTHTQFSESAMESAEEAQRSAFIHSHTRSSCMYSTARANQFKRTVIDRNLVSQISTQTRGEQAPANLQLYGRVHLCIAKHVGFLRMVQLIQSIMFERRKRITLVNPIVIAIHLNQRGKKPNKQKRTHNREIRELSTE